VFKDVCIPNYHTAVFSEWDSRRRYVLESHYAWTTVTAYQVKFCQGNTLGGPVHPVCYPGTNTNPVLARTIRGLGARLQAALTAVDANVLKAYLREWREAHCHLPWNGRRALRIPVLTTRLPCFPLWHLAPWGSVSTTKRLRTYFTQHFYCLCKEE
jgi:hypothetical protein